MLGAKREDRSVETLFFSDSYGLELGLATCGGATRTDWIPSSPETVVEAKVRALSEEGMVKRGHWRQRGSVDVGDEEHPREVEAGARDINHGRGRSRIQVGSTCLEFLHRYYLCTKSEVYKKRDPS